MSDEVLEYNWYSGGGGLAQYVFHSRRKIVWMKSARSPCKNGTFCLTGGLFNGWMLEEWVHQIQCWCSYIRLYFVFDSWFLSISMTVYESLSRATAHAFLHLNRVYGHLTAFWHISLLYYFICIFHIEYSMLTIPVYTLYNFTVLYWMDKMYYNNKHLMM